MSNVKITQLTQWTGGLTGSEAMEVVVSDASYRITTANLQKVIGNLPAAGTLTPSGFRVALYKVSDGTPYSTEIGNLPTIAGNLPVGGTSGQLLVKQSSIDYDAAWEDASSLNAANRALSNLSGVAINADLLPGTDNTIALGDGTHGYTRLSLSLGATLNWGNGTYTLTQASGLLTASGDLKATNIGVNATADATNRLSVNSQAVLFNNDGTSVQVKLNKAAVGDTASFLFQDGFSGRAEIGLVGSDDFVFKTSPDGSAFTTGLQIAAADGIVTVPTTDLRITNAGTDSASAVTVGGTQTLTNKTLTIPTLTSPVINGTVTGTAVDTASSASTLVKRDANQNAFFNNYFANATLTTAAAGTTVLTAASSRYQALTGTTSQTYQLPDATTLSIGPTFVFNNNSSGSLIITNAGGSTLYTVPAGGLVQGGPTNISSANGNWDFHPFPPGTVTWGSGTTGLVFNTALSTTPSINAGTPSATVPAFIPQRGSATTGYSGDSTHLYGVIGGAAALNLTATALSPGSNDGVALGTTALQWSDLFLASGGVINWGNGATSLSENGSGNLKLNDGLSGGILATSHQIDANGYFQLQSGNPVIGFDALDYIVYDRSTNVFTLNIQGFSPAFEVDSSSLRYGSVPIYSNIPQNSQSAAYTLVLADAQKHILHPTADNNARTFTIPANASVAFPIGTAITFVNQINTVTIAITSDTLVLAGAGTTGSRTLAANGIATALKIASTTWMISGTGLT